jgi:hypothetical protein
MILICTSLNSDEMYSHDPIIVTVIHSSRAGSAAPGCTSTSSSRCTCFLEEIFHLSKLAAL